MTDTTEVSVVSTHSCEIPETDSHSHDLHWGVSAESRNKAIFFYLKSQQSDHSNVDKDIIIVWVQHACRSSVL